jgi:cytochrome c oxidase subunit 3
MTATSSERAGSTGLMALVAAITMLFAAFTSAYIVRRGLAGDWTPVPLPWALQSGVLIMIAGSFLLKAGWRRSVAGLGVLFVLMQAYGLHKLTGSGSSIAASPAAAFLSVLAGTFAVFVLGAVVATIRALPLRLVTVYWHYLTAVWTYLVILLYLRR